MNKEGFNLPETVRSAEIIDVHQVRFIDIVLPLCVFNVTPTLYNKR